VLSRFALPIVAARGSPTQTRAQDQRLPIAGAQECSHFEICQIGKPVAPLPILAATSALRHFFGKMFPNCWAQNLALFS
jgi:hypothetical protein